MGIPGWRQCWLGWWLTSVERATQGGTAFVVSVARNGMQPSCRSSNLMHNPVQMQAACGAPVARAHGQVRVERTSLGVAGMQSVGD